MSELTGQTLGRYQIIERLGRGGMADVYKAYQPRLDRYVAIKVMHPHLADQAEFITRFEREARAVAKLRHPNIIQVFDFDVQDGRYFMAMEYVEGSRTLKEVLTDLSVKQEYLTLPQILKIIARVADALDYAHHQGMIHRDIKPSNILMKDLDTPLLSDFGIARLAGLTGLTATNISIGTPAYIAPELGKGEKASEQSDIYALGIVLYECLTGNPPFDADTPYGVIMKHINSPLIPPHELIKNLPDDVERIVLKSLAKNSEDRYASAAQMRDALMVAAEHAESNKVSIKIPAKAHEDMDQPEAPTVVEDEVIPLVKVTKQSMEAGTPPEEKLILPERAEPKRGKEPTRDSEGTIKARKKGKGWVWISTVIGLLVIITGGYFLISYLHAPVSPLTHITSTPSPKPTARATVSPTPTTFPQTGQNLLMTGKGISVCQGSDNCRDIPLFDSSYKYFGASWSPDASRFVFSACKGTQPCGLYISDLTGNVSTLVPPGDEMNAIDPIWSPDGNTIVFHGSGDLYITDLTGNLSLLVACDSMSCPFGEAWSPDSQWIAWIGGTCAISRNNIYVVNLNRSGKKQIFHTSIPQIMDGMIAWSPDGKSIVFMDTQGKTTRLDVDCEAQTGCILLSTSNETGFPYTWLSRYTP